MPITPDDSVPLDNKQLRFYAKDGTYTRASIDETIARGYNKWKGWHCSAGDRNLYIDYDGNVWIANCASAGFNKDFHTTSWKEFRDKRNEEELFLKWKEFRENIIGADGSELRKQWITENTENGWPMPDTDWENCEQQQKLMAKIEELEIEFEKEHQWISTESNNVYYKEFLNKGLWRLTADKIKGTPFGYLGDIWNDWKIPEEWAVCPYNSCGCGADVILSKVKDSTYVNHLAVTLDDYTGQYNTRDKYVTSIPGEPVGMEMNFPIPYQILWDLTRRCNYDCNYCWPSVHNKVDPYHSGENLFAAIDKMIDDWAGGNEIRWNFGGGEPTMHPNFLEILKYLKSKKQWVLVTTNGSRSSKFWQEACQYVNTVNMSAHFGSMDKIPGNEDRFIENCRIIMEHHDKVDDDFWIEIKLMVPPGYLDRALVFKQRILDLNLFDTPGANGRMKGVMSLVPIRSIEDSSKLVDYSENEIEFFRTQ